MSRALRLTIEAQARAHMRHVRAMLAHPLAFTLDERMCVLNRWRGFRNKAHRRLAWDYRRLHRWRPIHTLRNLPTIE